MTNAKQIRQVFKPLMERHDDLVHLGAGYLWLRPVRHVALRVLIERSSHKDMCTPQWTMVKTFIPGVDLTVSIGQAGYLMPPESAPVPHWIWSDPTIVAALISAIETEALPRLRAIDSLQAFQALYADNPFYRRDQWPENRMIVDIALGDLDEARILCESLEPEIRENRYPDDPWFQKRRRKVLAVAEPLFANDRAALAEILHGWEADNIRGTKIEPYWEPTPFPLETAPG
ncbi:hypothetical protein [Methylobacterium marchantiae]|uniref:DUF4304 domain-containing protein n=1 Tax=Methylobacterium marchantiae TaxID=600331 RepID=A0ABW3X1E3_9HYPH|nr:hypothetical protein AIGOOFII_1198 [Methylobacterium marchantiae]